MGILSLHCYYHVRPPLPLISISACLLAVGDAAELQAVYPVTPLFIPTMYDIHMLSQFHRPGPGTAVSLCYRMSVPGHLCHCEEVSPSAQCLLRKHEEQNSISKTHFLKISVVANLVVLVQEGGNAWASEAC